MAFGGGFGGGAFGASTSSFGNPGQSLFGQSAPAFAQSASAFGQSTSLFGQSAPAYGQSAPVFGQSASVGGFGAFGSSQPSLWGQSSAAFGATQPFGAAQPALGASQPAFGASQSAFGGLQPPFGASQSAFGAQQTGFGASQPAFGASQPAFGGASQSLFGAQSLFSSSQPGFGASKPAFGAAQPGFAAQSQPQGFGGQSQLGASWGGQQQQTPQGPPTTRSTPYQISSLYDSNVGDHQKFMAITAMDQYNAYSIEELRAGDYARGDKSGASAPGGMGLGSGFGSAPNAAFGASAQSAPGFGSGFGASGFGGQSQSGFAAPSQPAFGAQSQGLFGAQSQPSLFGASSGGAFGASSGGLFGSAPQSGGLFGGGAGGAGGGFGSAGFGATGFGQSSAAAPAFGSFGATAQSQSLFGGAGTQQTAGGLFGGQQQSGGGLFGSQPQSGAGLFGAQPQTAGGLFGAQPQTGGSLFGAQQPAGGSLFGAQQSGASLFGGQPQSAPNLFGASSAALPSTSLFGAPPAQQPAQSAPSLFGPSAGAGLLGGVPPATGGLFGAQSGGSLFGNTGSSLFGSGAVGGGAYGAAGGGLFGAGSGPSMFGGPQGSAPSLFQSNLGGGFGLGFGQGGNIAAQQQQLLQQQQGPLEASVGKDPYGTSQLFSSAANQLVPSSGKREATVVKTSAARGQTEGREISVVVGAKTEPSRRLRSFQAIASQSATFRPGEGYWHDASPVRHWGIQGSVFNTGITGMRTGSDRNARSFVASWRNEEQRKKAANIRKLVIRPVDEDPILRAASGRSSGLLRGRESGQRPMSERVATNGTHYGEAGESEEPPQLSRERPVSLPARGAENGIHSEKSRAQEVEADVETTIEGEGVEEDIAEEADGTENAFQATGESEKTSPHRFFGKVEEFNSTYVPYQDSLRAQMRRSRRLSGGSAENGQSSTLKNQYAPFSSRPDLYTSPSLAELEQMSEDELSHIADFRIWRPRVGEIQWQEPVDLRGINLDETVRIEHREVCVYPREEDVPPKGKGLNRPAVVRLHEIWKTDKQTGQRRTDATSVASIVQKLKSHCDEERLEFVGYDVGPGTWTFKAHSF